MALKDEETEEPAVARGSLVEVEQKKGSRRSFENLARRLSPQELASPGVGKMLVEELERLERECEDSKDLRASFHSADKNVAVLEEKLKTHTLVDMLSTGAIALGSACWGLVITGWEKQPFGYLMLGLGTVLIVIGVLAKKAKP